MREKEEKRRQEMKCKKTRKQRYGRKLETRQERRRGENMKGKSEA